MSYKIVVSRSGEYSVREDQNGQFQTEKEATEGIQIVIEATEYQKKLKKKIKESKIKWG